MIELFKENLQVYLMILIGMGIANLTFFSYLITRDLNELTNKGTKPSLKEVLKHVGKALLWILIQLVDFLLVITIINAIVFIAKSI